MTRCINFLVIGFLMAMTQIVQAEDCTFVGGGVKEPNIHKDLIKSKVWDEKTKEYRAILENGDFLFIAYSYCDHFGMEASLMLTTSEYDPKALAKSVDRLASLVLTKKDLEYYKKGVHRQSLKIGANLSIPNDEYDDFGIQITAQGAITIITISYYFT